MPRSLRVQVTDIIRYIRDKSEPWVVDQLPQNSRYRVQLTDIIKAAALLRLGRLINNVARRSRRCTCSEFPTKSTAIWSNVKGPGARLDRRESAGRRDHTSYELKRLL